MTNLNNTTTDQERSDFEAWAAKRYPALMLYRLTDKPENYFSGYTQAAWDAWQARTAMQSQEARRGGT